MVNIFWGNLLVSKFLSMQNQCDQQFELFQVSQLHNEKILLVGFQVGFLQLKMENVEPQAKQKKRDSL